MSASAGKTHPTDSEFSGIERAAAEWVVRQQQPLTRDEQAAFDCWLLQDTRHAAVFTEMNETSVLLDRLHDPAPADILGAPTRRSRLADFRAWALPAMAAAAALAVIWVLRPREPVAPTSLVQTVAAERGSLRKLDLPDGSVVQLNVESAAEVLFLPHERRVRLIRGEAHFTVAHDALRPFIVSANHVAVTAVGTAFDVRFGASAIEVLVTDGKVQVTDAARGGSLLQPTATTMSANPPLLVAGQYLQIPLELAPSKPRLMPAVVQPAEMQRRLAWKEHRLEFSAVPLSEVVAEFNRHNSHRLTIDDPALARLKFGGAFTPHGYEAFVELLEQSFGVVAERRDNETILRRKP